MTCNGEIQDRALVTQCLEGSRHGWDEFYNRFFMLVAKAVRTRTRCNEADVPDLIQSVFLALYTSLHTYDHHYPLSKFVWIVSERVCIDEFRKSAAAKRGRATVPLDLHDGEEEGALTVPSDRETQDRQLEDAEGKDVLRTAFKQLGEKCREILRLRYFQELSFKEIAVLLGTKEKTLAVQAGRCLRDLKNIYMQAT